MHLKIYSIGERKEFYNELLTQYAAQVQAPIYVFFVSRVLGQEYQRPGEKILGRAGWLGPNANTKSAGHYVIALRRDLSPKVELDTLAHELAHVLLGHCGREQITEQAERAYWRSIPPGRAYTVAAQKNENAADQLAAKLLREWKAAGITAQ